MGKERCYEEHHWSNALLWAEIEGSPEEVAETLVKSWNSSSGFEEGYVLRKYPNTPEFKSKLSELIDSARKGEELDIVADGEGDSLCLACRGRRCK